MSKIYKEVWVSEHAPHNTSKLTDEECKALFKRGGWAIREIYDFDSPSETSFYAVIKDQFGDMEELSKKVRTKVRKALKTYEIRKATLDEMLRYGADIYYNAFAKYRGKCHPDTRENLEARFRMVAENDDYDAWIMFRIEDKAPVAWSITHVFENMCEYETVKVDAAFLDSTYPSYGLFFTMNQHYLAERKLSYVNAGWRSVTLHSNIQPFLIEQFNFRKAYCKMNMRYKFPLNIAVSLLFPFRKILPNTKIKTMLLQEAFSRGLDC
ncbi:MAG: hypothetical protein UH850_06805 [Paludibacteraceae bacterium]|nr:hypothetical protein [Paludibacteraceae bacterium]